MSLILHFAMFIQQSLYSVLYSAETDDNAKNVSVLIFTRIAFQPESHLQADRQES